MKKSECRYLITVPKMCFFSNCYTNDSEEILEKIEYAGSLAVCKANRMSPTLRPSRQCPKKKNQFVVDKGCWTVTPRDEYGNTLKGDDE